MRLYLQFGYGMMAHCEQLVESWRGGTVILSPRDSDLKQLEKLGNKIKSLPQGRVLFDPQFYLPHADHERLRSHDFWPAEYDTAEFWNGAGLTGLIEKIYNCNQAYGCGQVILPGMLAAQIDEDWLATQQAVLDAALAMDLQLPMLATIALGSDAASNADQIATLLERAEQWEPAGYYVVCEHPDTQYLVSDEAWVTNVLALVGGLRLRGAKVILGYCNQQMLIAAMAKVHALCSGTWLNVRAFSPDKFVVSDDIRRKSIWYYCPQALSEYKIPALDRAQDAGVLNRMRPPASLDGGYATALFSGAQPTSVAWGEQEAFRHYLHALRGQARRSTGASFNETVDEHNRLIDAAEAVLNRLEAAGIDAEVRDFRPILETNRAALRSFVSSLGPLLRRRWSNLN